MAKPMIKGNKNQPSLRINFKKLFQMVIYS